MARRYRDSVQVQTRPAPDSSVTAPAAFVWRGRLYVVRALLDHWHERRDWWRDVADGDEPVEAMTEMTEMTEVTEVTEVTQMPATEAIGLSELEQDVWRVEASAGRLQGRGVYDLVRRGERDGRAQDHQWRLVRVAD